MLSLISECLKVKSSNLCRGFNNQGVCHTMSLPFTLKIILKQKKKYVNSNIFTMQKYNLQKSFKRNQNPSRYYNSKTNFKFQHKLKYHFSKILI
jgi:hypothetical protein